MRSLPALFFMLLLASAVHAADWYASPTGESGAAGTREKPFDIATALMSSKIAAGDTLWLLEGVYKRRPDEQFDVKLVGAEGKPVIVRPESGKRVTIDGGLRTQNPSAHVWIRDLEIIVSEPHPTELVGPGSHPPDFKRP
ncbi:MAG TPA: hypothetical protein VEK08_18580, partial [Planctomycetota bacterium]|nr:hypothetical protein [Planctomycetota bacterium]